jgi:alkanesulfonate monooxygenase SsuD/methylene tetrahydromethanopterin reductase-like flavin-dependent oxidoreductase (luciferase family)
VPPEELAPAVAAYRENQAGSDPSDFSGVVPNFQVAAFMTAHCDADDRRGRAIAGAAARWYLGDNEAPLNRVRFGPDFDRARFAKYTDDALVRDRMVVGGDPDTCSRVVEAWVGVGVDQLILMVQAGVTPHDEVMRAIELLGTKVLPRFQDPS